METLTFTARELKEIELAIIYTTGFNHGTDGHNRLNLIAKMALWEGFSYNPASGLIVPPYVAVEEAPRPPAGYRDGNRE